MTPCLLLSLLVAADPVPPPAAAKKPVTTTLHGDTRTDDYAWLKNKKDPEVIRFLDAENAHTAAVLQPTEPLQAKLYAEYLGRIQQTDSWPPVRDRGHWYYTRTEAGKQYPVFCRRTGTVDAPEQVLMDDNELAREHKFFQVGATRVSDDGHLLAFTTDTTGYREYFLSVKDLRTGKLVEGKLVKVAAVAWAADNRTLFYTTEDPAKRPHKLWRHTLGRPATADVLVYEETDPLFNLGLARTRDNKLLVRTSSSYTSTEQAFLPSDQPAGDWRVIRPRQPGVEYTTDHRAGRFFVRTNAGGATNFKVMTAPAADPAAWADFLPYDPAVAVEAVAAFAGHLIVSVRENGLPQLLVRDLARNESHRVTFPEAAYDVALSGNPEADTLTVRFTYGSLVTPTSVYDYHLTDRTRTLLKRQPTPGYDPDRYATERVYAPSADGTRVPVTLVYKKGLTRDGTAGCLLYGYGSYGATLPVRYEPSRVSLLDRGVVYAQAHVRGGSDLGRTWYDAGKMLTKMNTFVDFRAAADFLVNERYCKRERLALQGASAGGLLVGATLNLNPTLCGIAVLDVPFVDVVNTMLDESLPLTTQEFQQWGNPKVKAEYDYLKAYCPYTNLQRGDYPAVLVTTSLNDSQVAFHEPAKYVAKLRTLKTDPRPLLLRCNMDAGHGGASGRYDRLKEVARTQAFVLTQMGIGE